MDFITIDNEKVEVILYKHQVEKHVKQFNRYYTLEVMKIRQKEDEILIKINEIENQEDKIEAIESYVSAVEKLMSSIKFPYNYIYDIIWDILPEYEKKRYKNKLGLKSKKSMIKAIRNEELQALTDFIAIKVIQLSLYNKKKV